MQYQIRRMVPEDIPAVVGIEELCFSEPWSAAVYNATLLLPYAHFYVAELTEDGISGYACSEGRMKENSTGNPSGIVGMIGLELIAGDGEISNVAVLPRFRRKGIAHSLMAEALEEGQREGCSAFTLEVRKGNTAAIALYESFGFRTEGVRKNYYDKPAEDALILWRREEGPAC